TLPRQAAVPSALRGLTAGFGMVPGVSPSRMPPALFDFDKWPGSASLLVGGSLRRTVVRLTRAFSRSLTRTISLRQTLQRGALVGRPLRVRGVGRVPAVRVRGVSGAGRAGPVVFQLKLWASAATVAVSAETAEAADAVG